MPRVTSLIEALGRVRLVATSATCGLLVSRVILLESNWWKSVA